MVFAVSMTFIDPTIVQSDDRQLRPQRVWVIVAGAGMGILLGPANTDAMNRSGNLSYGEATGIAQTIRNYGASLGLAALGTIRLFSFVRI